MPLWQWEKIQKVLWKVKFVLLVDQDISNTGFESPCSAQETIYGGESCRFSPLETPSAVCPPQEAGFTFNKISTVINSRSITLAPNPD